MFTNNKNIGEEFGKNFRKEIKIANHLEIASGFFSADLLNELTDALVTVAKRGSCKLLFGMIYHQKATLKEKKCLTELDQKLKTINSQSGIFISTKPYHGKVFKFKNSSESKYYIGSSNFSFSGFKSNVEFNLQINETEGKKYIDEFLDFLFYEQNDNFRIAYPLEQITLTLKTEKNKKKKDEKLLNDFQILDKKIPHGKPISTIRVKLRPDEQPASSLNLYFDQGRKTTRKGRVHYEPRPWYEIEITTKKKEQEQNGYPKGNFTAFATDGDKSYQLEMTTCSGNKESPKAIQSKKRRILGEFIKGKLERKGSLKEFERVTSETLEHYGRDYIELKQMSDKTYILEF